MSGSKGAFGSTSVSQGNSGRPRTTVKNDIVKSPVDKPNLSLFLRAKGRRQDESTDSGVRTKATIDSALGHFGPILDRDSAMPGAERKTTLSAPASETTPLPSALSTPCAVNASQNASETNSCPRTAREMSDALLKNVGRNRRRIDSQSRPAPRSFAGSEFAYSSGAPRIGTGHLTPRRSPGELANDYDAEAEGADDQCASRAIAL